MQVSRRHEFVEMVRCSRRPRDRYRSETEEEQEDEMDVNNVFFGVRFTIL
jgi:hypothetical protein